VAAPGYWYPNGDRSPCSPLPQPATGRAQAGLNSRLRGVSFAAITGVRDHLRRSSRLSTACRVRRLRGQHGPGDDHPSRRTARSGRPLEGVGPDHGIRAQADRSAPGGRSIRCIRGWECRAGITRGIAGRGTPIVLAHHPSPGDCAASPVSVRPIARLHPDEQPCHRIVAQHPQPRRPVSPVERHGSGWGEVAPPRRRQGCRAGARRRPGRTAPSRPRGCGRCCASGR
jgi:hypothetical protein